MKLRNRTRLFVAMLITVGLTAMGIAFAQGASATTYNFGFNTTLSADTAVSGLNQVDEPVSIFTDTVSGTLYYYSVFSDGNPTWHVHRATSQAALDSTTSDYKSFNTSSLPKPHGDDRTWIDGVWVDTSTSPHTWYGTAHVEFNYGGSSYDHFRRIILVTSTDEGGSWSSSGDIVTSAFGTTISDTADFPGNLFNGGPGDQHLFVDAHSGYFYILYSLPWIQKNDGTRNFAQRIARCPMSSVIGGLHMAPGCWQKWYNGAWSTPGIGGLDSDVAPNVGLGFITWNSALSEYVLMGTRGLSSSNFTDPVISVSSSLATMNWTPVGALPTGRFQWYNSALDPSTSDDDVMSSTSFRVYSSSNNVLAGAKYMTVTLDNSCAATSTCTPLTTYTSPVYAAQSVPDRNPGWDAQCSSSGCPTDWYAPSFSTTSAWNVVAGAGTSTTSSHALTVTSTGCVSTARAVDFNSPSATDEKLRFSVTPTGQRFEALFRYSSASSFVGVVYNNDGTFGFETPSTYVSEFSQPLSDGVSHVVDISLVGLVVTVTADGTSHSFTIQGSAGAPAGPGQTGLASWCNSSNAFSNLSAISLASVSYAPVLQAGLSWSIVSGTGTQSLSNNSISLVSTSSSNTVRSVDSSSPATASPHVQFTVIPTGQRFGLLTRYTSTSSFLGIFYNSDGTFNYETPSGNGSLFSSPMTDGVPHIIDVSLSGAVVTVSVDGVAHTATVPGTIVTTAGHLGFYTWFNSSTMIRNVSQY
jgi:hypothetical protein